MKFKNILKVVSFVILSIVVIPSHAEIIKVDDESYGLTGKIDHKLLKEYLDIQGNIKYMFLTSGGGDPEVAEIISRDLTK